MRELGLTILAVPLLGGIRVSLRLSGFAVTRSRLARLGSDPDRKPTPHELERVERSVVRVARRRYIGGSCLPRSLLLWTLLRRSGANPELVVGAAPRSGAGPLVAHAWVELDGRPIAEAADVRDRYPVFDRPVSGRVCALAVDESTTERVDRPEHRH